jgi:hypothetical protein
MTLSQNSRAPGLLAVFLLAALGSWTLSGCGDPAPTPPSADAGAPTAGTPAGTPVETAAGGPATAASAAWTPGVPLPLHALLIGVGAYPEDSGFGGLHGPPRDVEAMRRLLVEHFGAAPDRVRVLLDADATVEGIVRAIDEHLIQRARPGEEALLFYSGHGSRVFDATGRERGGRDSSLVAYDSRSGGRGGSYDITDDVLHSLLKPLADRGVHVVALTDACHSGGVLRDGFRERFAPEGSQSVTSADSWAFWPQGIPFLDDDARDSRVELASYVHIAACTPEQRAYEYPFAVEGHHGLMTWAMVDVLRRAQPDQTWADLAERVAARIQAIPRAPIQSTWIEGTDAQRELFGRRFRPVPDRLILGPMDDRRFVRVDGGSVHGLQAETLLRATDEDGLEIGRLTVVRTTFATAMARWREPVPDPPRGKALYAEVLEQPADLPKLQVHSADPRLLAACADSSWADVADEGQRPYVLEVADERRIVFRTEEGIPIWDGVFESAAEPGAEAVVPTAQLEGAFRRETRFQALWKLADPDRRGQLGDLRIEFVTPGAEDLVAESRRGEYAPAPVRPAGSEGLGRGRAARGEFEAALPTFEATESWTTGIPLAGLRVTNENLDTVYVHLLSLNEAREVTALYGEKDRPATMDQPSRTFFVELGAMSEAVFPLERPMLERHLVIASKTPLDVRRLENRVEAPKVTERGARDDDLPGVLQACIGGGVTRSGGRVDGSDKGWGVTWIDLWIERKSQ